MYLVAIAWMYVVVMMAIAEAFASNGSVLGALITFVLYGLLPLSIVMYVLRAPARRSARRAREAAEAAHAAAASGDPAPPSPGSSDASRHAARDPVAPVRKEA
jgi:hypothetical protein